MEMPETQKPSDNQLISVPHKDTIRLLEVYVKRSLSLNDGAVGEKQPTRKQKWVTLPKRQRRSSSDPSLHLAGALDPSDSNALSVFDPATDQPENISEESKKPTKKSKKKKKPTFWKSLLGFFSQKTNEDKDDEQDGPADRVDIPPAAAPIQPTTPVTLQKKTIRKKSIKKRFSKRRLSLKQKLSKDVNAADITGVEAVEPTYSYYEKVSEEMEKIVHEVKVKEEAQILSDEEVINRIVALTKEHGDAIDNKMKEVPSLNNFFQKMSYSSFQKLADAYLEKETTPAHTPLTVLPTAPELVKLAFTLDFTARIAGLSKQNVGHITGLGNLYLQDRFKYKQACTDHPWSDSDD